MPVGGGIKLLGRIGHISAGIAVNPCKKTLVTKVLKAWSKVKPGHYRIVSLHAHILDSDQGSMGPVEPDGRIADEQLNDTGVAGHISLVMDQDGDTVFIIRFKLVRWNYQAGRTEQFNIGTVPEWSLPEAGAHLCRFRSHG
jgi:hypothetical protein